MFEKPQKFFFSGKKESLCVMQSTFVLLSDETRAVRVHGLENESNKKTLRLGQNCLMFKQTWLKWRMFCTLRWSLFRFRLIHSIWQSPSVQICFHSKFHWVVAVALHTAFIFNFFAFKFSSVAIKIFLYFLWLYIAVSASHFFLRRHSLVWSTTPIWTIKNSKLHNRKKVWRWWHR